MTLRGYEFFPGPLKADAVIARWHVTPGAGSPRKLHVDAELTTDITFGKSSPARAVRGESVIFTLNSISAFIASDVLPSLTEELGLQSSFRPGQLLSGLRGEVEAGPATFSHGSAPR